MLDDKHLHISEDDTLSDLLGKALCSAKSGAVTIDFANERAVSITANDGRISVNLLRPAIFGVAEDETSLFDKLKTASEFGQKLSDNGVTLSFLRKGKEALRLGRDAKPTFSKLITRSDDIQVSSLLESAKLKNDFKAD
jgi:hypothetical protein